MTTTSSPARRRGARGALLALVTVLLAGPAATVGALPAVAAPVPHVPVVTVSPAAPTPDDAVTVTSTITGCAGATADPLVLYLVQGPSFQNDYYGSGTFSEDGDTYTVSRTFPPGTLVPGAYTAESYGGLEPCYPPFVDDYFYSERVSFVVALDTTVSGTSSGTGVVGEPVVVDVLVDSASATGPVTIREAGVPLATGTVAGGTARVEVDGLGAGAHQLVVEYAGDATHRGSTSAPVPVVVQKAASPLTIAAPASSVLRGDDVTLDVTGPAGSQGEVVVTEGAAVVGDGTLVDGAAEVVLEDLAAGTHQLVVAYGGDADHLPSTATTAVTVALRPTTTSLQVERDGAELTLVAEVLPDAARPSPPQGSVRFLDGDRVLGTATLADGGATLVVPDVAVGSHALRAEYLGDGTSAASGSVVTTAVVPPAASAPVAPTRPTTAARPLTPTAAAPSTAGALARTGADGTVPLLLVGALSLLIGSTLVGGSRLVRR